nr:adenylate kinase isoenzyme 5-like [Odocoileus virginianus texanus]
MGLEPSWSGNGAPREQSNSLRSHHHDNTASALNPSHLVESSSANEQKSKRGHFLDSLPTQKRGRGPGSGKGTQCGKLVEKYGFTHLSTGELLRNELSSESERSKLIRGIMERGERVPSGIILELLKEAMVASLSNTKGFLIDGYPREVKQGEEFGRRIGDPHLVICMDCSADTMTNRLLQRSRSSPQTDDNTTTIAKRLETYYRASIPVVAYYETKTQLHKINAEGTPEEVFLQLCTAIDSIF